jgi:predicted HTH transcriptional regulator
MSLFTTPLNTVNIDDVQAFLDLDLEEGTRLDYKEADPKQVIPQKTLDVIVAFVNTAGGLFILGVKADKTTNRPIEREGLPLLKGLEERITSQCFSSILPAYIPEIRICPFKSNQSLSEPDRAFVIIRVQPSNIVHSTKENRVLVRVNSECRDADLMTLHFLFERERRSEEILEQTQIELSQGRMATIRQFKAPNVTQERFAISPQRTFLQLLPLDAPTVLLPFSTFIDKCWVSR